MSDKTNIPETSREPMYLFEDPEHNEFVYISVEASDRRHPETVRAYIGKLAASDTEDGPNFDEVPVTVGWTEPGYVSLEVDGRLVEIAEKRKGLVAKIREKKVSLLPTEDFDIAEDTEMPQATIKPKKHTTSIS